MSTTTLRHTSQDDPIVTIPPINRNNNRFSTSSGPSWENPQDLLDEFRELTNGSIGQKIGVFDTGIDWKHPFIKDKANISKMMDFTNSKSGVNDFNGHGTFVFYQLFQRCPNAEFVVMKVLDDNGSGTSSGIVRATEKATELDCNFINASLGASQRYDPMGVALDNFRGMFFAASGNSGGRMGWPAGWGSARGVIPTGAFRSDGRRSSFSSIGQAMLCMGAGENINSAAAQQSGWAVGWRGTSMGTPSACALTAGYQSAQLAAGMTDVTSESALIDLVQSIAVDVEAEGRDPNTGLGNLTLKHTISAIKKLKITPDFGVAT